MSNATAETAARREDEAQLRDLALGYARMMDDRAFDRLPEVFAADGLLSGPGYEMKGYDALAQGLKGLERFEATLHCVHNAYFELDGDRGTGEVYCVANHVHSEPGVAMRLDMGIRYQDEYVRTPAGWRIQQRVFNLVWESETPMRIGADGRPTGG